jgi:hypothetical protein
VKVKILASAAKAPRKPRPDGGLRPRPSVCGTSRLWAHPQGGANLRGFPTDDQRSAVLDYGEVLPLPVFGLQLVNTAIVCVEEIAAVRDRMMMGRTHRAASPPSATRSSPTATVFPSFLGEFDAVLNFVFDAGKPRGHQTSASLQLFFSHNVLRCNNLAKGFAIPQEPS